MSIQNIKEVQIGNESLTVYRSEGGGIFGIDSSAIDSATCPIYNPFTGKLITPEELDAAKTEPVTWNCCEGELGKGNPCRIGLDHADTKTEPVTWNCCEGELGRDDTCRICGEGYDD